jgi:hypothetical protein
MITRRTLDHDKEGRWGRPRTGSKVTVSRGELSIPGSTPLISYDPKESFELPQHLVEVATGLTTPAEFIEQYGLLGYSQFHRGEGIPPDEFGDPPFEYVFAANPELRKQLSTSVPDYLVRRSGEPVRWFEAHARTVKAALDLLARMRLKDEDGLQALLKRLPNSQYAVLGELSSYGSFDWVSDFAKIDLARATRAALTALVNPNLQGLQRILRSDAFGNLHYEFVFQSLIQAIYWHVAMRIDDEKAIAKFCKRCGEPFFHRDPRQAYCPKPLGVSRSLCQNRTGVENHRTRWANGKSAKTKQQKIQRRNR